VATQADLAMISDDEIRTRVAALGKFDFRGAEALAKELLVEGRVPLRALQRLLIIPGSPELGKTETLLGMLNELSILPWLVAARNLQGTAQTGALTSAFQAYDNLGQQIVPMLRSMLGKRTALRPPDLGPLEVKPPIMRECDHAYLLLRRLAKPDEAETDSHRYGTAFSRLSDKERERLILGYVKSNEFGDPVATGTGPA
jgi:hypothetical protein